MKYALKNDLIANIEDVENGLKCGCLCLDCGEVVIAKNNGKLRDHHFSHAFDSKCGGESYYHSLAKRILFECKQVKTPKLRVDVRRGEINKYKEINEQVVSATEAFQEYEFSVRNKFPFRSDVAFAFKSKMLFIEILNSHQVDEIKLQALKESNYSCFEIDIKGIEHQENVIDFIIHKAPRKWLNNAKTEVLRKEINASIQEYFDTIYNYPIRIPLKSYGPMRCNLIENAFEKIDLKVAHLELLARKQIEPEILEINSKTIKFNINDVQYDGSHNEAQLAIMSYLNYPDEGRCKACYHYGGEYKNEDAIICNFKYNTLS